MSNLNSNLVVSTLELSNVRLTGAGPGLSPKASSSSVLLFSELQATSSSVDCDTSVMWEITLLPSTDNVRKEPEMLL